MGGAVFVCVSSMPDLLYEFVFSIIGIVPKLPFGTFAVAML